MSEDFKKFISLAVDGPLSRELAEQAFEIIMEGQATPAQVGGFLMALRSRGEALEEYAAAASVMRAKCNKVDAPKDAIDIVGTGGDGKSTLNISTATAIVVAGAGIVVAKHGNRNLSSKSGAADALSELGINVMIEAAKVQTVLDSVGIAFMMAPMHHPAVKHVMPARQELGTRTVFNILGPLTNPAGVKRQLTGAFSENMLRPMAETLLSLGTTRAWLVHGSDGTDEIAISGPTRVVGVANGRIDEFEIHPSDAGLSERDFDEIRGGTPSENAAALRSLLDGDQSAYRDAVLLNSAAAIAISGDGDDLKEGVERAVESIDSGKAKQKLAELVKATNE